MAYDLRSLTTCHPFLFHIPHTTYDLTINNLILHKPPPLFPLQDRQVQLRLLAMSSTSGSRFTSQNKTTQERLSSNTVGLVALSDFRKRRAEVLEQQEREAREAISVSASASAPGSTSGTPAANNTPDRSLTSTPDNTTNNSNGHRQSNPGEASVLPPRKKKKSAAAKKIGGTKLSFGGEDEDGDTDPDDCSRDGSEGQKGEKAAKFKANYTVSVVPRSVTKSALRREAAEREFLRREFLARQEAVKATEIAIPFVFYDGTNIPGGVARVRKGDFVWVFLDKSRKLGADLGKGGKTRSMREWARVGVDDLIMVRGSVIIPHVSIQFTYSLSFFSGFLILYPTSYLRSAL